MVYPTIDCAPEQVKELYRLGLPIEGRLSDKAVDGYVEVDFDEHSEIGLYAAIPATQSIILWFELNTKYAVDIEVFPSDGKRAYRVSIHDTSVFTNYHSYDCVHVSTHDSRELAEQTAVDELIKLYKEDK